MVYVRKESHACRDCGEEIARSECTKNGAARRRICRPCWAKRMRAYVAAHPDYRARRNVHAKARALRLPDEKKRIKLRIDYGITLERYNAMLHEQGGVCAICRCEDRDVDKRSGKKRQLAVDHCHGTDVIRGLLCGDCNRTLGLVKESPETLVRMISYLAKFQTSERRAA